MDICVFGQRATDSRTKGVVILNLLLVWTLLKRSVYFLYAHTHPFILKNLIIYKTPESKLFLTVRVHECFSCLLLKPKHINILNHFNDIHIYIREICFLFINRHNQTICRLARSFCFVCVCFSPFSFALKSSNCHISVKSLERRVFFTITIKLL